MKNLGWTSLWLLGGWCFWGCASAEDGKRNEVVTNSSATAVKGVDARPRKTVRQSERPLGPDERRVVVFVVPGDALVEIDGQRVERRDGVVEMVGKVGDVHRLRAWKGDKSTDTKEITIAEGGATPSFVDVNEVKPTAKNVKTKSKAARFDVDE